VWSSTDVEVSSTEAGVCYCLKNMNKWSIIAKKKVSDINKSAKLQGA